MRAYDKLVNGTLKKEFSERTPVEREASEYFSDYNFCKTFGWTPEQLYSVSDDYYNNFSMIMNAIGANQEAEQIRMEQRNKRNQNTHGRRT